LCSVPFCRIKLTEYFPSARRDSGRFQEYNSVLKTPDCCRCGESSFKSKSFRQQAGIASKIESQDWIDFQLLFVFSVRLIFTMKLR
jgi:hypothetical protein